MTDGPGGRDGPLPAAAMAEALGEGRLTSAAIVRGALRRIDRLDAHFGSVLTVVPDALARAEESDRVRRRRGARSPLEGIPVVVKDNVDMVGLPTTAGALALARSVPPADAHLVARLREAGAVIVAKTNLSELANFLTEGMPSGYSSIGGQVLNPYDTSATPSGSSSGSAVAVALGLAPLAVGTETDGSIISPAVYQSLVGVKPTVGLVSRTGIFPIAPSQDTAGPMAATVADAALLLAWMSGSDPDDPATAGADPVAAVLRREGPGRGMLAGRAIAAVSETGPDGQARPSLAEAVLDALRAAGAGVEVVGMQARPQDDEMAVLHHEFAPAVATYFTGWPEGSPRSLADIGAWNTAHPDVALKFGQSHVDAALAVDHEAQGESYRAARERDRHQVTGALDQALGRGDVLAFRGDAGATWAARSGWPSITVPIGYSVRSRRPLAVSLVGRPWSEPILLSVAAGVEGAIGGRRPPREVNPALFARLSRLR